MRPKQGVRDDADIMEREDERQDFAADQQLYIEEMENLDCLEDCSYDRNFIN